jgi:hypothetical protein
MHESSLYSAYFIASFGVALPCIFMYYRHLFTCDLLCLTFLICVFGVTLVGAMYFSAFGVQAGILFTLIASISLPWIFAINYKNVQGEAVDRIFQFILGGLLCLSSIIMSRVIEIPMKNFGSNLSWMSHQQWFSGLLFCTLLVGLGGVLICINRPRMSP